MAAGVRLLASLVSLASSGLVVGGLRCWTLDEHIVSCLACGWGVCGDTDGRQWGWKWPFSGIYGWMGVDGVFGWARAVGNGRRGSFGGWMGMNGCRIGYWMGQGGWKRLAPLV
jgi:hypothetical protein